MNDSGITQPHYPPAACILIVYFYFVIIYFDYYIKQFPSL